MTIFLKVVSLLRSHNFFFSDAAIEQNTLCPLPKSFSVIPRPPKIWEKKFT